MKKYIVESWIKIRDEFNSLGEAHFYKDALKGSNKKDIVIIEVEITEKKL